PALLVSAGGRLVDCNQAAVALLGYDVAELREVWLTDLIDPNEYRKLREAIEGAQSHASPVFRLTLRKKDGEDIVARVRLRVVDGTNGKGTLVVLQDVREHGADGTDATV
ncbi:MAG: PAS domain-containing protein, partial [Nitrososphaerales archaeon]